MPNPVMNLKMKLRLRSCLGTYRIELPTEVDGADHESFTVSQLKLIIAKALTAGADVGDSLIAGMEVALDPAGQYVLVPDTAQVFSDFGIRNGTELFLIGKFEKEITQKSSVNEDGVLIPAGTVRVNRVDPVLGAGHNQEEINGPNAKQGADDLQMDTTPFIAAEPTLIEPQMDIAGDIPAHIGFPAPAPAPAPHNALPPAPVLDAIHRAAATGDLPHVQNPAPEPRPIRGAEGDAMAENPAFIDYAPTEFVRPPDSVQRMQLLPDENGAGGGLNGQDMLQSMENMEALLRFQQFGDPTAFHPQVYT